MQSVNWIRAENWQGKKNIQRKRIVKYFAHTGFESRENMIWNTVIIILVNLDKSRGNLISPSWFGHDWDEMGCVRGRWWDESREVEIASRHHQTQAASLLSPCYWYLYYFYCYCYYCYNIIRPKQAHSALATGSTTTTTTTSSDYCYCYYITRPKQARSEARAAATASRHNWNFILFNSPTPTLICNILRSWVRRCISRISFGQKCLNECRIVLISSS